MKNANANALITVSDIDHKHLVQLDTGIVTAVISEFSFDKITGVAKVTKTDGTVTGFWQCRMVKSSKSEILGWIYPAALQADLPPPDVTITSLSGTITGYAYSVPIPGYWDTPVAAEHGIITHYAASGTLPDASYVESTDLFGNNPVYILAP